MNEHETPKSYGFLWPLWGVAAGALGFIAHGLMAPAITDDDRALGPQVVNLLERAPYHIGAVTGMVAVFCLLVVAAGWRRWFSSHAPDSLAAGVIPLAIAASAGALIFAYGVKGMLAIYLPGGIDLGMMPEGGLFVLFIIDDMAAFLGWWGVAMAAGAFAWLSLAERRLPIWFGVLSGLFTLASAGFFVVTGLPGFPGIVMPFWLIITGIGMTLSLRRSEGRVATRAPLAVQAR